MERNEEAASPASSWLGRAYYTPLGDVLRGRLSARWDFRRQVAAAGLPATLAPLILQVVGKTRLWRAEKADVARELIAHFGDGVAAGRSPEELVRDFGDADQAARLIRAAKRRNRPLWWQALRLWARVTIAASIIFAICYAGFAARFYMGTPHVAHNYWHEINQARRVEDSQRAWPLYREALYKLGNQDASWIDPDKLHGGPDSPEWREAKEFLERHQPAIDLVREGATKPRFGYYLGDKGDFEAARKAGDTWLVENDMPLAEENKDLIEVRLFGPQYARQIARLLIVDARVFASEGDSARTLADLMALVALSDQLFEPRATLVEQLIGAAIYAVALDACGQTLADTPDLLSDEQLTDLAHRIAAFRGGRITLELSGEKLMFDDLMQRAYTDDGNGDGRITPEGIRKLAEYSDSTSGLIRAWSPDGKLDRPSQIGLGMLVPAVAALVGSREENRALYYDLMDSMIAGHQPVPWQWDTRGVEATQERFDRMQSGLTTRLRYSWVALLLPGIRAVFNAAERATQARDAAEVAIALVLYHRRHGEWPESLEQLVPELLPAAPTDRADGKPLRYRLRDGRPVVYSVGNNRVDDGGLFNPDEPGVIISFGPKPADWDPASESKGDWILWPPPPRES